MAPSYVGRPATADPIAVRLPQHPGLAPNGLSAMHNDGWSSDAYAGPGPLGRSPEVDSAWYGIKECATLAFDSQGRMIALCGKMFAVGSCTCSTLTPCGRARRSWLPERGDGGGKKPWENLCGGSYFYLDWLDRAVVATTGERIVTVTTSSAEGDPDLAIESSIDLSDQIPDGDCLIALMPDWKTGDTWWVTERRARRHRLARPGHRPRPGRGDRQLDLGR